MNKLGFVLSILCIWNLTSFAQTCSPDSLVVRSIEAAVTDSSIGPEFQEHQVYLNPDCIPNGKLLLHLVGTIDNPASTTYFPALAANHGYKAISLKYPNSASGTLVCKNSSDIDCHWKYRQEVIFGTDTSSQVNVDSSNSIVNRFEKLLLHLDSLHPNEGWNTFFTTGNIIDWSKITVSGHSQGGGHAAFLGKYFPLDRIIMFASPNEYSAHFSAPAAWINLPSVTPDSNHYAFGNLYDDVVDFEEQYLVWNAMQLNAFGDTTQVEGLDCPYENARMLYTTDTSASGIRPNHNLMIIDNFTPLLSGTPIFTPVWKYMLGICGTMASVPGQEGDPTKITLFPNPMGQVLRASSSVRMVKIEVINSLGEVVKVFEPNAKEYEMDLDLPDGFFFFKVATKDNKGNIIKVIKH